MIDRRAFLSVLAVASLVPKAALSRVDAPFAFDFETLQSLARDLRGRPYVPAVSPADAILDKIHYVEHGEIRHDPKKAFLPDSEFPFTAFPLAKLFRKPVRLFTLVGGKASEIPYDANLFAHPSGGPGIDLPDDAGFAGFRLHDRVRGGGGSMGDWAAFLGASYFRADGDENQYGISARGVAVNTEAPLGDQFEEFPDFTRFYVSPAKGGAVEVLALLDGPSVTGAFRFVIRHKPHATFDVNCRLYLRKDVRRLGIAPGTSMFDHSETIRWRRNDWRPEVHDSDGLLMANGSGEWIWRPLNNPPRVMVSYFADESPKGFGLMQRDRAYENYLDPGVRYDRRPHLWVEPKAAWGKGTIQLVEIPTSDEYHDNIVAFWVPEKPARAGDDLSFDYRLRFSAAEPGPARLAKCVATRTSRIFETIPEERPAGGEPTHRDFILEFSGPGLAGKDPKKAKASIWANRGHVSQIHVEPRPQDPNAWRVFFRVHARGELPVELGVSIAYEGKAVTETWLSQYHPEHLAT